MKIYVKKLISILCFFLVLNHDFVICIDFTHIAALNTVTDDVANKDTHIEFLIQTCNILLLISLIKTG